jgi:integrase
MARPVARRRLNGEGSIFYEKSRDRWVGKITLEDGSRRKVTARTSEQVMARLDALKAQVATGLPIGDNLTVGELLDRWITDVVPARDRVKSTNTVANYRWAIEKHLAPALGKKQLRKLTTDDVERLLRRLATEGLVDRDGTRRPMARNSVSRVRSVLVAALDWACARDLVGRNVARLAAVPASARPKAEGRSLTPEEGQRLLTAARGHRLEALFVTGLLLGLRPGELCGLSWDDVDLATGTLQVRRALKRERDAEGRQVLRLGEPKTPRSRRGLDLPRPVAEALRSHRTRQLTERVLAGPSWHDERLVFCTAVGTPIDPSNLRSYTSALTKAAGLGHWTPYELRHSAVSLLSAAGVPLEQIADVAGHDGTRMTAGVYRHLVKPTVGAHVDAMEAMFGE